MEGGGPAGLRGPLDLVSGEKDEATGLGLLVRITERMLIGEVSWVGAGEQALRGGEPVGCPNTAGRPVEAVLSRAAKECGGKVGSLSLLLLPNGN